MRIMGSAPAPTPITTTASPSFFTFFSSPCSGTTTSFKTRKKQQKLTQEINGIGSSRREAVLQMVFSTILNVTAPAIFSPSAIAALNDAPPDFRVYSDDANKYQIFVPQDWQIGGGQSDGIKSLTAFYPEESSTSNVSVLITGLGPDFTRLESFGKVDAFAENLVSGLDRSWQRPPGVAAKLIDSKSANGLYYIEYTLQNPGESRRHIYSVMGIANNGWYNRLYTVTGQFLDDEAAKYSSKIEKAIQSFRLS